MLDFHTLSLIGVVSQVVFALTLLLLAFSDRQTRGTFWLAAAAALRCLFMAARGMLEQNHAGTIALTGSCLLVLTFFFSYMGVRWFAVREPLRTRRRPVLVSSALLATLVLGAWSMQASIAFARVVSILLLLQTVPLLWGARVHGMQRAARWAVIPLLGMALTLLGRLLHDAVPPGPWTEALNQAGRVGSLLFTTAFSFSFVALFLAETQRRLHDETRLDALTGLRNRRSLEESAARMVLAAGGRPLSLMVIDVDHFKTLNDSWGHAVGDRALQSLGDVLRATVGATDLSARIGGEEFAVLLPEQSLGQAARVAETVRLAVNRLGLREGAHTATFSVSIGVSSLLPGERVWIDMLRRADKALYRAKNAGRDQVCTWCASDGVRGTRDNSRIRNWRRTWSSAKVVAAEPVAEVMR